MPFADTRTTATSMCSLSVRVSGYWPRSRTGCRGNSGLRVNEEKSAVDRPWKRDFLGYSMTHHKKPRLKVARKSVKRLKAGLREVFRWGRGRKIGSTIEALSRRLVGWVSYYRLAEVKNVFEELDGWICRKLRNIIWRQWKRPFTREKNLVRRGLDAKRAWKSASNGRGPWWNSGASHMNQAFPRHFFEKQGLVSLQHLRRRFQCST